MNTHIVAKNYGCLTPEERFRLILAASGRRDVAERDRLAEAGARISLSLPDHAPFVHAFQEIALLTYIELADAVAQYCVTLAQIHGDDHRKGNGAKTRNKAKSAARTTKDRIGKTTACQQALEEAGATGYVLRTKAEGWKLFCERLCIPPFLLWEEFPGFDRLQSALAVAEKAAFAPECFLRWFNRIRPVEEAEMTEVPLTVEGVADDTAESFRQRSKWWSGR